MEKIKNTKVKILKVGRIWVHATNPEYNNKIVKIQINEFFTKEFAKVNVGKEIELTCKIILEKGYVGYDVIMYPISKSQQQEIENVVTYEFIKENLHWTKKAAENGKFYLTPKVKEKMEILKGTYKEEIEEILSDYKKLAEEKNKKIIVQKIKSSILKWTAEKAEYGEYYISNFVKENLEKISVEDKEEIEKMLLKYKERAKENVPFYYNLYLDIYLSKEECQKYIGNIIEKNGRYGIVKKAYCYKVKDEDSYLHSLSAYTVEMKCKQLFENDERVILYKKEKEDKLRKEEKEIERNKIINEFVKEFKEEFSNKNKIDFSSEEKEIINSGGELKITGEEIWLTNSYNGIVYGTGKFLKITESYIWIINNNGADGAFWGMNFIYTGGAGGYGYKIEKTEKRIKLIEKLKELKIKITL